MVTSDAIRKPLARHKLFLKFYSLLSKRLIVSGNTDMGYADLFTMGSWAQLPHWLLSPFFLGRKLGFLEWTVTEDCC